VLAGGRSVVLTSFVTTLIGAALGALAGIGAALAGLRRGLWEGVIMRPLDAVLAVPPLLLVLLFLTSLPGRTAIIAAVVLVSLPLSARVVRAAAVPAVRRAHVEAAVARGERLPWIVGRELLPFVAGPLIADAAVRFVLSAYLVAAAGFLGLGPDAADWGVQISEALPGAELQPWALAAPVVLVGLLGISANVFSDEMSRRTRSLLA
jgi:ABC-type dipeptide/oligopeptide/nickel transport system permease subunit